MNNSALEPAPTRFFAPVGLFSEPDLNQMGAEWLGEWVKRPGYEFADGELEAIGLGHLLPFIEALSPQRVASGPQLALLGEWQADTHSFESAYEQDERGRWRRYHANHLPPQGWDTSLCGGSRQRSTPKLLFTSRALRSRVGVVKQERKYKHSLKLF